MNGIHHWKYPNQKSMSALNPVTRHKEFGGLPGVIAISLGLPSLLIAFHQLVNEDYHLVGVHVDLEKFLDFRGKNIYDLIFDKQVWTYYLLWFFGLAFFDLLLPGYTVKGVQLRDGTQLSYLVNGVSLSALLAVVLSFRYQITNGQLPELQFLYSHILEFTVVAIVFSFLLALFVYATSFIPLTKPNGKGTKERVLSLGGNTGNFIYDWFIGRELNPRIGSWDIKLFCELRPGMLLWLLINLASMHHQYLEFGYITDSMLLFNVLQAIYVIDGVLNEEGCLTMMDITTDGFGFMLAFGDLALVPFSYTLHARYLALEPVTLGPQFSAFIIVLSIIGFYIFKASNNQKDAFRQGKLRHLKSIPTERSTKLLVDGWWKLSQHPNYFGDWLYALAWCLTAKFKTPLTFYYAIYFASLLLHRQQRDSAKCKEKYGKAWEEYEKQVPYKIFPWVY